MVVCWMTRSSHIRWFCSADCSYRWKYSLRSKLEHELIFQPCWFIGTSMASVGCLAISHLNPIIKSKSSISKTKPNQFLYLFRKSQVRVRVKRVKKRNSRRTYNSANTCTTVNSDDDCEWISMKRRLPKQIKNKPLPNKVLKRRRYTVLVACTQRASSYRSR